MPAPTVAFLALLCVALGGCPGALEDRALAADEDGAGGGNGSGSGDGAGQGLAPNCVQDTDCAAAAPKCCDCPTHAVPTTDPSQIACANVNCGPMQCGAVELVAACKNNYCVLVCEAVACDATAAAACPSGFATDANGCLTCECAGTADIGGECTMDVDCARVRNDCCGCTNGGEDTAVPASQAAQHDAMLYCPSDPVCPGGNTCAPDLAARCVQGTCELVAGPLPPDACGRADLPACPSTEACYVNTNDQATMHGVGVCDP